MKPKWEDAPKWAEYLARDGDGMWYWHEKKPERSALEFPDPTIQWLSPGSGRVSQAVQCADEIAIIERRPINE